jgi:hypothetical protein
MLRKSVAAVADGKITATVTVKQKNTETNREEEVSPEMT